MYKGRDLLIQLGRNIKAERIKKGYSQEFFAEKIGVSREYISRIERGKENMSILKIIEYGNPILRQPTKEVSKVSKKVKNLVYDMLDTMYQANGVGLAAPQVGVLRRAVLVIETNVPEGEDEYIIELINPEIQPAPQELQDKHYLRKHGPNAYYGQKK